MSGQFWLDWLALAISLFNTVVLAWLGLTVLFNAERRTWGVFLAVGGLLAGAAFFLSHSVVVSQGASALIQNFGFWWQVGWIPLVAAPYIWYLLMLWYSGYWDDAQSRLRRRQRFWFWLPWRWRCSWRGCCWQPTRCRISPTKPTSRLSACPPSAGCR